VGSDFFKTLLVLEEELTKIIPEGSTYAEALQKAKNLLKRERSRLTKP
jgi:hypothetical protein